eukprot:CAMPEP_0184432648 /NCGR_PEP_ID=MMETSP0738-20130409/356464_1 /TAXON_ID=385413 /ORGANISM="Thalassiosira miniscula, Strain CCMP1093" /LENGTH=48 /DNA_ID= /DNA_START= /DNA_END= /DNA_ORIENTATION=
MTGLLPSQYFPDSHSSTVNTGTPQTSGSLSWPNSSQEDGPSSHSLLWL